MIGPPIPIDGSNIPPGSQLSAPGSIELGDIECLNRDNGHVCSAYYTQPATVTGQVEFFLLTGNTTDEIVNQIGPGGIVQDATMAMQLTYGRNQEQAPASVIADNISSIQPVFGLLKTMINPIIQKLNNPDPAINGSSVQQAIITLTNLKSSIDDNRSALQAVASSAQESLMGQMGGK